MINPINPSATHRQNALAPEVHQQTVLVIDDEYTSRTILGESIQGISPDIHVKLFDNPIAGLEWLETNRADLVFTDYNMKQLSGHMVLKKIRTMTQHKKTPVVIVSAIVDKGLRYQLLEDGALDFIGKPIDLYEFVIRCKNILQLVDVRT